MPHESFKDTIKDCITWIRLCLKLLCHNKFICHISILIWWIITWILGASSFRPSFVHSARKVKPVHVIVSLFRILQIPRFCFFFLILFFVRGLWRPGARQGTGSQTEPQGKSSHSGRTWLGHPHGSATIPARPLGRVSQLLMGTDGAVSRAK